MKFLKSLKNKNLSKETCLLRIDLNIEDNSNFRLISVLPTIRFLLQKKARIIILSHRGRPILNQKSRLRRSFGGQTKIKNQNYKKFSLRPLSKALSRKLKHKIHFVDFKKLVNDEFFTDLKERIKNSPRNSIFLLENLRFLPGEEKNDKKLAKRLASLGTFYVNDAFAVSHRKDASLVAITEFLPSYVGFLMEKEIKNLSQAVKNPQKPLVIILGGVKISGKINFINALYRRADYFLTGGGIANSIMAARGLPIGNSICEKIALGQRIVFGGKIVLPDDAVVWNKKNLDIGPKTIKKYMGIIKKAKSIIWNGPFGLIENERFRRGSEAIRNAILKSRAHSIIGGGETTMLFEKFSPKKNVFISTGGGAMLEFLAGKKLPGIEALKRH